MEFSELVKLAEEIICPPYEWRIGCITCNALACRRVDGIPYDKSGPIHYWFIEACLIRKDTHHDTLERGYGGKNIFPHTYSVDNVIKRFFVAARDYSEHEVREAFKWRGKRVLSPHMPLETLWEVMGDDI